MHKFFFIVLFFYGKFALAFENDLAVSYLHDRADCLPKNELLYICGSEKQRLEVEKLIEQVRLFSIGQKIWQTIENSGKNLLIAHSDSAVSSAGRALAPLTTALSNGRGTSSVILFNFDIPDTGGHRVGGTHKEWTEFTKEQKFFHELVHAKNYMSGTSKVHRLEEQVIEEENIFRIQSNPSHLNLRSNDYAKGEQIWFPSNPNFQ